MKFIYAENPNDGIRAMSQEVSEALKAGKKVLWLLCGGSNVPLSVEAMELIRTSVDPTQLSHLTVSQTDERYGPDGHPDANWQQLKDDGFNASGCMTIPVLRNMDAETTTRLWGADIEKAFAANDVIIAQFGIGADGHIAGVLPHSPAVTAETPTAVYEGGTFTRVTITPRLLGAISSAYVFVFGQEKNQAIEKLRNSDLEIDEEPCQILKKLPRAVLYGNQAAIRQ